MVVHTFREPVIPFKADLILGMMPGRQIIVGGVISPQDYVEELVFSFSTGTHIMDDVIFNITFDYYYNTVYLNSYLNYKWGEAETIEELPFLPGNPFQLEMSSTVDEFSVKIEGKPFCTYEHREDPLEITTFEVFGDAELTSVEIWDDLGLQTIIPEILPECPLACQTTYYA